MAYEASIIIPTHPDDMKYALAKTEQIASYGDFDVVIDDTIGLARSTRLGIEKATCEKVIVIDCDRLHPPEYIPRVVAMLNDYDLVKCSRINVYHNLQGAFSIMGNYAAEAVLGCHISDYITKYYGGHRSKLLSLDCWHGHFDYIMELLYMAKMLNWSIYDMPFIPDLGGDNGKVSHTRILKDSRDYLTRMINVRRSNYGS